MSSKREQLLQALLGSLSALQSPQVTVAHNLDKPQKIPDSGMIVLRDGASGEPEMLLSPLTYIYEHIATLEVMVQNADQAARDAMLDNLLTGIAAILSANRTLGGLAEWMEPRAPEFLDEPVEGAATMRMATVPVMIRFFTADPLN